MGKCADGALAYRRPVVFAIRTRFADQQSDCRNRRSWSFARARTHYARFWRRLGHAVESNMSRQEVVVVTGASAGVGRAVVRAFAKRKAAIGLIARGIDGLEGAKREVEQAGGKALVL